MKKLEDLPIISSKEIERRRESGCVIIMLDEMVVDVTNFQHPGGNYLFLSEKIASNILFLFKKNQHSINASKILCDRIIGTIKKSEKNPPTEAEQIYQTVYRNPKIQTHFQAKQKINFDKPILNQLIKLSNEEIKVLTEIPILDTTSQMRFTDSNWKQFWYTTHFWASQTLFYCLIVLLAWLIYSLNNGKFPISEIHFFVLGVLKWTLIQYYFHRFLLHDRIIDSSKVIGNHYMHHIFPNMKSKVALSAIRNSVYLAIFALIYCILLSQLQAILMICGVVIGFTVYDAFHYYFHYGPQINCNWLCKLRIYHLLHHYKDTSKGYGVTSSLWDQIFGTKL